MADILSRAPPPLPSEARFAPLVKTKIGPANKGYNLLEKRGWKEGEGLGAWRRPQSDSGITPPTDPVKSEVEDADALEKLPTSKSLPHSYHSPEYANPNDTSGPSREIIDLTLSDDDEVIEVSDDDDENEDDLVSSLDAVPPPVPAPLDNSQIDPSRTVLLTPIPTFLKPDRLGIGASYQSKSSTSQSRPSSSSSNPQPPRPKPKPKPFTDTSQAMHIPSVRDVRLTQQLAAHRKKGAELRGGRRGSKGFASVKKEEDRRRRDLLAYMNS